LGGTQPLFTSTVCCLQTNTTIPGRVKRHCCAMRVYEHIQCACDTAEEQTFSSSTAASWLLLVSAQLEADCSLVGAGHGCDEQVASLEVTRLHQHLTHANLDVGVLRLVPAPTHPYRKHTPCHTQHMHGVACPNLVSTHTASLACLFLWTPRVVQRHVTPQLFVVG
jgi:hypothetical protein